MPPIAANPNSEGIYRIWLNDPGQQALVTDGDRSPTSPNFLAFKNDRSPEGQWLAPEEIYRKRQFEALQNEEKLTAELEPFTLEAMNLQRNPTTGAIEKLPPKPLTPEQQFDLDLENEYKTYLGKAQAGELSVSLGTEKQLAEQEEMLNEAQSRRLGSGWRESTPGIKQAGNFMLTSEATKEAERHGDLNTAAGLLNQRQASLSDMTQRRLGLMEGIGSPNYSLVNAYGQGQQPYLFQGLLNSRNNAQSDLNRANRRAGDYKLLGNTIGTAGTAYALSQYNQQPQYQYGSAAPTEGQPFYSQRANYAVALPNYTTKY